MKQIELSLGNRKKNGVSRISLGKKRTKASTLVADWWFHKMKKDFRKNSLYNMGKLLLMAALIHTFISSRSN